MYTEKLPFVHEQYFSEMTTYSDDYEYTDEEQEDTLPVPIVDIKTEKKRGSSRHGSPTRTGWSTDRTQEEN